MVTRSPKDNLVLPELALKMLIEDKQFKPVASYL